MGYFLVLAQEGVNDAKKVESELKNDKDHISVPTYKSTTFTFMSHYKHLTSSFFLATPDRPTLDLALHRLDRLNALRVERVIIESSQSSRIGFSRRLQQAPPR